jgi:imidazolonepropionase-like amidohydrolase
MDMNMTNKKPIFLTAVSTLLLGAASMVSAANFALINCNVFNGVDERIDNNVTVIVEGKKISKIGKSGDVKTDGIEVVDCEGNYLMPGLIDVHTHLDNMESAHRALVSGTTTVRSASVEAFEDVGLRELVRIGELPGPDVVAAGIYVTPNLEGSILADPRLAPLYSGVNSDEELRLLVNVNIDRGVDVIKTRGTERAGRPDTDPREQVYTRHQLSVVVDEAAKHDIPVMVHAHGDEGALAAVQAGARSIEHGTYLSEDTLKLMKEKGTWFVPTYITMLEMNEEQYDNVLRIRGSHMVPRLAQSIRDAHRIGVKFATGADNYYDEKSINRISLEVMYLTELGLSPFEAMQAATVSSAELLMLGDKTGRVADGYEADLILLAENPLQNVMALQDVLLVVSNGEIALKRIPFGLEN